MTELLRLDGVGVTYRNAEQPSLVDASFSVSSGEVVGQDVQAVTDLGKPHATPPCHSGDVSSRSSPAPPA